MKTDPNCVFCKIIQGDLPCYKIYEDEVCLAFLDLCPINTGQTLIVPREHEDHLWDIDQKIYTHLFDIAKKLSQVLRKTYTSKRVGMMVEGFQMPHAHIIILPIYKGSDSQKKPTKANQDDLSQEAQKIISNLSI
jgi:histidine triad (HIT) family protein